MFEWHDEDDYVVWTMAMDQIHSLNFARTTSKPYPGTFEARRLKKKDLRTAKKKDYCNGFIERTLNSAILPASSAWSHDDWMVAI